MSRFWSAVWGLKKLDGLLTAIATMIVAIATILLYCATQALVHDTQKNTEANTRAWLVPTGATFFEKPLVDSSIVKISLENFGKIPAVNVRQVDEGGPVMRAFERQRSGVPYIDSSHPPDWPTDPLCSSTERKEEPIGYVFPNQKTHYLRHMSRGNADDLNRPERNQFVIVRGCIRYNDSFGAHASPYCFYSLPATDKAIDPADWSFAPCLARATETPN
jgi:hypothetical protein